MIVLLAFTISIDSALAHTSERAFVLLLPTGYYLVGGALAVAASFVVLILLPHAFVERLRGLQFRLGRLPTIDRRYSTWVGATALVLLVASGFVGSRDPLANPLPLAVWTLIWVGLVFVQAVLGDVWSWFNPWLGPARLLTRVLPMRAHYPEWLGYWPAIVGFACFAWFELVYPAPDDPDVLAFAVILYTLYTVAGSVIFGLSIWFERGECFSVFFRLIAKLSPFRSDLRGFVISWPGHRVLDASPLPLSGVLFVLLVLSSVSFDGLSRTYWWLDLGGINPLEFPGRTDVMDLMSVGLTATWLVLAAAYLGAIKIGNPRDRQRLAGSMALSILPISLAYHFAHYLPLLLVNGQYALAAISDPFALGWNLLGTRDLHVTTSFLSQYDSVRLIWNLQAGAIVLGHVMAVLLAHLLFLQQGGGNQQTPRIRNLRAQIPLAVLMVFYTLFGLWLLSTPIAG